MTPQHDTDSAAMRPTPQIPMAQPQPDMARVVERNIQALLERRHEEQRRTGKSAGHDRGTPAQAGHRGETGPAGIS
jgi:hypothetical protein